MNETSKVRILFVDDEPNLLQSLRRMLHGMRGEWDMDFAESGIQALEMLERKAYAVLVTDMVMPGMSGIQLLEEAARKYPHMARIVLSGQSDRQMVMESIPKAHQFLAKPCAMEPLVSAVEQALALDRMLGDPGLRRLIASIPSLPSPPRLCLAIRQEVESGDASIARIAQEISKDPGMTAKILQIVNSAFFGLAQKISNPVQAVMYLGLNTVEALILSNHLFSQFQHISLFKEFLDDLRNHSMQVSEMAKEIMAHEANEPVMKDEVAAAGILHDCGKLILADHYSEQYLSVLFRAEKDQIPDRMAEEEAFGHSHAAVGAALLSLWGLPRGVVEAVAFSHSPLASHQRTLSPLTAVHVADALIHGRCRGNSDTSYPGLDRAYLRAIGLEDHLPRWEGLFTDKMKEI